MNRRQRVKQTFPFLASVAPDPDQWYSFKPIWPLDPAESETLAARAARMLAGEPG